MTPRSRKPLMLPGALVGGGGGSSSGQAADQSSANSISSFREEDEDAIGDNSGNSNDVSTRRALCRSKSEGDFNEIMDDQRMHTKVFSEGSKLCLVNAPSLSSPFR